MRFPPFSSHINEQRPSFLGGEFDQRSFIQTDFNWTEQRQRKHVKTPGYTIIDIIADGIMHMRSRCTPESMQHAVSTMGSDGGRSP